MRRNVPLIVVLIVALAPSGAPPVRAQNPPNPAPAAAPAPAPAAPPIDPQRLKELLDLWEQNSARLKSLDVDIKRTDKSKAWGDEFYAGRAMLKSPNRAFLDFSKQTEVLDPKTGEKKMAMVPHERIVCTGSEFWVYRSDSKQIFIYPLEKDVQQHALEEGPLPFLFNFKKGQAEQRYEMALVSENANFSLIQIVPRLPIDQEVFKMAWVRLDRRFYLLPSRIILLMPDGKSSKDYELIYAKDSPNKRVMDENFQGKEIPGWKVVRNPDGDGKPAPAGGGVPVRQPAPAGAGPGAATAAGAGAGATPPAQQPAMRGRLFGGRRN